MPCLEEGSNVPGLRQIVFSRVGQGIISAKANFNPLHMVQRWDKISLSKSWAQYQGRNYHSLRQDLIIQLTKENTTYIKMALDDEIDGTTA